MAKQSLISKILIINVSSFLGMQNCRPTLNGTTYVGPTNYTFEGVHCIRWDSLVHPRYAII